MSCNGCRVLRKGCSDKCVLRSCLQWIQTPEGQGNATLFLAKFFGRSDLLSLIAAVPETQRPALFQSLLFEACGRTVNPVNGAVGLLSTGNWHLCQAAVDTVLAGGNLQPSAGIFGSGQGTESSEAISRNTCRAQSLCSQFGGPSNHAPPNSDQLAMNWPGKRRGKRSHFMENWPLKTASSMCSEMSEIITVDSSSCDRAAVNRGGPQEIKLLNLFV